MNLKLRYYVDEIISSTIANIQVDGLVRQAIEKCDLPDKVYVVAIGKAAWQMAKSASDVLGERISCGVVITKYEHCKEDILNFKCYEAGHPVLDENSIAATQEVLRLVSNLTVNDYVLFLVSGGGSALFENPLISLEEYQDITNQLLRCGANIHEINTIRKRLSSVKGGKFANMCYPAHVHSIVISDVIGNSLDVIASGPTCADTSTCEETLYIVDKYKLNVSKETWDCLSKETPKKLNNVSFDIISSVDDLCQSCAKHCERLGFDVEILPGYFDGEARDIGICLREFAREHSNSKKKLAFITGGESVVHLSGNGLGGRNQELVLGAASSISSIPNVCVFSFGSDGTDGPTDAAGGYVDGDTLNDLSVRGIKIQDVLLNNDSYHALKEIRGLIMTGPTGTNVNDVAVVLVDNE